MCIPAVVILAEYGLLRWQQQALSAVSMHAMSLFTAKHRWLLNALAVAWCSHGATISPMNMFTQQLTTHT
jgi:hypothetical protein